MPGSVNAAWGILRGRLTGDKKKAANFLSNMDSNEREQRNRLESRMKSRFRKKVQKPGRLAFRSREHKKRY